MPIVTPPDVRPQNRRRSKRVQIRIPVLVRLRGPNKASVSEKTEAIIVNDHGALILLATEVQMDQIIHIENPTNAEELLCRVISRGDSFMGKTQIGVEFIVPTPGFWRIPKPKDSESSRSPKSSQK